MNSIFDAFSIFAVAYFVLLIFIGAFFLLNLTLAVIKAKFSDNQMNSEEEVVEEEEIEMTVELLKEYRHMERDFFHVSS